MIDPFATDVTRTTQKGTLQTDRLRRDLAETKYYNYSGLT